MRHRIADTKLIANTFYIVFFGVLFSFFFSVRRSEIISGVPPWFLIKSNILFFLLMAYYIFDWLTSNEVHRLRGNATVGLILIGLAITIFLGTVIVYSLSEGVSEFLILGIYTVLVPFWDIPLYRKIIKPKTSSAKGTVYLVLFIGVRFIVALYLMMLILLHEFFSNPSFYQQVVILIAAYLSIKIIRYLYLIDILAQIENANSLQS